MKTDITAWYSDPRSWSNDFSSSWKPEKYGVDFKLHSNFFNIPKENSWKKLSPQYNVIVASECWELLTQKALYYLKKYGFKIFLLPREPIKSPILKHTIFHNKKFLYDNKYYFAPDVILSPGQAYSDLWQEEISKKSLNTKVITTGYTRFDYLIEPKKLTRKQFCEKYKLNPDKKIIFFPSYPPFYFTNNGIVDLWQEREDTLAALKYWAKDNKDYQIIIKIHPSSMKPFKKGIGRGDEVSGLLLKYYKNPATYFKVFGDNRMNNQSSKEFLLYSDIIVGFSSTMLLEGAAINKPVIHTLFGKAARMKGLPEYVNHIPTAYNDKELFNLIKKEEKKNYSGLVEKYLYKLDGKSCERICSVIKMKKR